jgi:hypothetical protein
MEAQTGQVKLEIYTACLMLGGLNLNSCGMIPVLVHLLKNNEFQTEIVFWEPVGLFHNVSQCGQQYCGSSLCNNLYSQLKGVPEKVQVMCKCAE